MTRFFVGHPLVESVIAQGPTKIERAFAIRDSMRSARGDIGRVSVCSELFYRQQGAQHRDAESRAATRLDLERISPGAAPIDLAQERQKTTARKFRRCAMKPNCIARSISNIFRRSCARTVASSKRRETRTIAAVDRNGESPRHFSLPYHRERWPQYARGNGGCGAGARACNISASPITAAARSRRTDSMKPGCERRSRRFESSTSNSKVSASSPGSSATSCATARSILKTKSWPSSIMSSPRFIPSSICRKRR